MNAEMVDYTLSSAQFNVPHMAFVEQYKRTPSSLRPLDERGFLLLSGAHIFFSSSSNSSLSSLAATNFSESARAALDLSLEVEKATVIQHLHRNLFSPAIMNDADAVSDTVDHTYELISRWGASSVNLNDFIGAENAIHLAVMLRVTADIKDFVLGWDSALNYAIQLMDRKEIDVTDALFGLI